MDHRQLSFQFDDLPKANVVDPTRLAYLAGFFDGEGCICVEHREAKQYTTQAITVVNRDRAPLELFVEAFGGSIRLHRHRAWGDSWEWRVRGRACKTVLEAMLPYLVIKRRRAQLALELINLTGSRIPGIGYPPGIARRRQEIIREIHEETARFNQRSQRRYEQKYA